MADIKFVDGVEMPFTPEEQAEIDALRDRPVPVPVTISVRQFWAGLAKVGRITKVQALSAIRLGTLPTALQAYVDSITDVEAQWEAAVALSGQGYIYRNGELIAGIQAHLGLTDDQVDAFFRAAGRL